MLCDKEILVISSAQTNMLSKLTGLHQCPIYIIWAKILAVFLKPFYQLCLNNNPTNSADVIWDWNLNDSVLRKNVTAQEAFWISRS